MHVSENIAQYSVGYQFGFIADFYLNFGHQKPITESSWFIDPDCNSRGRPIEWPTRGECQEFDSCHNLVMYFRNNRLEDREFKLGTPITPKNVIKLLDDEIKDTEVTAMKNDLLQELLEVINKRINSNKKN